MLSLELGESLLEPRLKEANLTKAEFARRLGVSRQFINLIIKKKKMFSLEMSLKASYILDCEPRDLYIVKINDSGLE
ncbi:helix-turn-helix transcriptional regulator [Paenibacillus sp. CAU 1782]